MGIVKISDELHESAKQNAKAMSRSINLQVEHWLRLGKVLEEHPNFTYQEVLEYLMQQAKAEQQQNDSQSKLSKIA